MKKLLFLFTIIIACVFFVSTKSVIAVQAAPSPVCEINAEVLSIKEFSEYYIVFLDITDIKKASGEGNMLCDDSYIKNVESGGAGLTLKEYNLNKISEGKRIKANIHFGGDERSSFHFALSNIQIVNNGSFWSNLKCFFVNLFGGHC